MKLSVIRPHELDAPAQARWRDLQLSNQALASPYFCPEFTRAVGSVRPDIRILVMEQGAGPAVGFFPFQLGPYGLGEPAGRPFSDHHGVIAAPGTRWDWGELLRAAGLVFWRFDHLCAAQAPAIPGVRRVPSPALDLSQGFQAYKRRRLQAGVRRIGELDRGACKLARAVGPLRFELHSSSRAVFDTVLRLKSQQYRRTGARDVLAMPWARAMLEDIWRLDTPGFGGRLSALWAGDQLVSASLGMCSARVWHWWLPAYDTAHARHSPGLQLLMRVAEGVAAQGHALLDLGKGDEAYKSTFADHELPLAEGCLAGPAPLATLLRAGQAAHHWLRESPLRPLVRRLRGRPPLAPDTQPGA
ncbi:GNAT family N-acetyltransferase [Ramlibacter tataouinensis]|uniref:BioF2-like acetyltransferase domain-containing protein n=1 Tax=Ramlibacter tataouinensis (strain ATCC BAA-407 / DSM 14655 / LMG 21543 / TTB310) TaxID=365046 RepID=F5Y2V2_RAMTT|nr:GNAT family N-acetyltransferase [Ramlibacter tataouinensis]AEG93648.1 Conserved hypothetical protein [Ramlibacter tataouinensis TTB310]